MKHPLRAIFLLAASVMLPSEFFCIESALETQGEVMRGLVDSRLRLKSQGKAIPPTLEDYVFDEPELRKFVHRYSADEDGREFSVSYFVVQPGITHSYSSKSGWFYYPD